MKKRPKILITIIILTVLVLINFRYKNNIENILRDIVLYPFNIIIKDKNLIRSSDFLLSELNNKNKEIKELKDLLNLNSINSNYSIINATVIGRNMQYFYDEVIINKGSKSGIKKNMIVVNDKGLIGKIIKTNRNNSTVKLITSSDVYNMLSVQIEIDNEYIYGILNSYDPKTNSFIVEGIDQNISIKAGSLVSTTGLGNIYPSGILIGQVVRIQKDNFDLAYILKVEPVIEFNNFNYVAVLDKG